MNVHPVGSVPFASAAEVFGRVGAALGPKARRSPGGETGERLNWVGHLERVFGRCDALERSDELFEIPTILELLRLHAMAAQS